MLQAQDDTNDTGIGQTQPLDPPASDAAAANSQQQLVLTKETTAAIETATQFLRTLFDERDRILFRPIESWTEEGSKKSLVDYHNTHHRMAKPLLLQLTMSELLKHAAQKRLNLFFGVCPRVGRKGKFDLAWQIRVVRTLWLDIDHVTVDDARERISKAGLPVPSVIVNSGNGAHVYWLLDEPYLIDDAGDPTPVETEWREVDGRKKPRRYIVDDGDRVYVDQRQHVSRLSPKAQHLQDVLAGIAEAVGGDHTQDLSRLLRIPGTLNRKDERNGREPVPTVLVECEASRRYPLTQFESLKSASPETSRAKQIALIPLAKPRKLSPSKGDKLSELIGACAIARAGSRSEVDFAVCCYAVKNGIDKEEVWGQVEQVGKFAERGRSYFDRTWDNAEFDIRARKFEMLRIKLQKPTEAGGPPTRGSEADVDSVGERLDDLDEGGGGRGPTDIVVDPEVMPVGDTLRQITDRLLNSGGCFSRADQLVVVHNELIAPILSSTELAGLLNQYVEFFFLADKGEKGKRGEYKPLPAAYGNTWLNNRVERARLQAIKLFTRNPVYTKDWRLVAPGYDAQAEIYYAGPIIEARCVTEHLETLLQDFCFKKPADRTNYLGILLTAILLPSFIGSKPAVLFNGNQPGLGKSILAQIIAILRDGHPAGTATYNPNDEEFEKRLGAVVRRGATTIIIDNAKGGGRNRRIESACLERSITDPILAFRLLGYSCEIRAENSHIFCITANTPEVSRDLVTRSVVINLHHEGDPKRRSFSINDPEDYAQQHRIELLGELIGMVERWKAGGMPLASVNSRFNKRGWGAIVGGILNSHGEPDFLDNAEEAAAQLDEAHRDFAELVEVLLEHPQGTWTAAELVDLCVRGKLLGRTLGGGTARSQATKLGILAGRFVAERFLLADGRQVKFCQADGRKGNTYSVAVSECAEPSTPAEPLPDLHVA